MGGRRPKECGQKARRLRLGLCIAIRYHIISCSSLMPARVESGRRRASGGPCAHRPINALCGVDYLPHSLRFALVQPLGLRCPAPHGPHDGALGALAQVEALVPPCGCLRAKVFVLHGGGPAPRATFMVHLPGTARAPRMAPTESKPLLVVRTVAWLGSVAKPLRRVCAPRRVLPRLLRSCSSCQSLQ